LEIIYLNQKIIIKTILFAIVFLICFVNSIYQIFVLLKKEAEEDNDDLLYDLEQEEEANVIL
jgi:hypothetical protein